jgi:hypothetical protein
MPGLGRELEGTVPSGGKQPDGEVPEAAGPEAAVEATAPAPEPTEPEYAERPGDFYLQQMIEGDPNLVGC